MLNAAKAWAASLPAGGVVSTVTGIIVSGIVGLIAGAILVGIVHAASGLFKGKEAA